MECLDNSWALLFYVNCIISLPASSRNVVGILIGIVIASLDQAGENWHHVSLLITMGCESLRIQRQIAHSSFPQKAALLMVFPFHVISLRKRRSYRAHFTGEKTEVQRNYVTYPRPYGKEAGVGGQDPHPHLSDSQICPSSHFGLWVWLVCVCLCVCT